MNENAYRSWCKHPESDSEWFEYFTAVNGIEDQDPLVEIGSLEQYINRKDKNGSYLFKGDILIKESDHKIRISDGEKMPQYSYEKIVIGEERGCFTYSIIEQENSYFAELPSKPESIWHLDLSLYTRIGTIHEVSK